MLRLGSHGLIALALVALLGEGAAASTVTTVSFNGRVSVVDPDGGATVVQDAASPYVAGLVEADLFTDLTDPADPSADLFAIGHTQGTFTENTLTPDVDGQEFGQGTNGKGQHATRAVTTLQQTITNDLLVNQAVSLDLLIRAGKVALKDVSIIDGTFGAAYLGVSLGVQNGGTQDLLATGTLLALKPSGSPDVSSLQNGLLAQLSGLTFADDPLTGATFSWTETTFTFDLGVLASGESIDLFYRMVSAGASNGALCYTSGSPLGCPETLVSFDDPPGGTKFVSRSAVVAFPPEPPVFVPAVQLVPPQPIIALLPPELMTPLLLPPRPMGVPAPASLAGIGLLAVAALVKLRRYRVAQLSAS